MSNDRIPLILLPGMDGTGELFADFLAHLPAQVKAQIVRFAPDAPLGYDALAQRVARLLPRDRPFALLGESFSGPLAIMLARSPAHVHLVRALILSCAFVHNPLPGLAGLRSVIDLVPINLLPKRLIADYFLGETQDERLMKKLLEVSEQLRPAVWRERVKAALAVDVSAQLEKISVPILYLRARNDRLVPPAQAERVKELAPQTQIVDFDTPHFLLQTAPREAAEVVGEFLGRALLDSAK